MENYWAHKITCIYFTNSVISDNSVCLDMLHLPPKEQHARWKQRFTIRLFGEARVQTQPAGLQTLSKGNLRLQICPSRWRRSAIAILVWTCHCQTVGFFDVDGDWQGHVIRIYKVYWQGYIMLNLFLMFWWCHSEKIRILWRGQPAHIPPCDSGALSTAILLGRLSSRTAGSEAWNLLPAMVGRKHVQTEFLKGTVRLWFSRRLLGIVGLLGWEMCRLLLLRLAARSKCGNYIIS